MLQSCGWWEWTYLKVIYILHDGTWSRSLARRASFRWREGERREHWMNDRQFFFSRILVGQHLFVGKRLGMHFHLGVPWKVQQQSQKHPSNPSMLHPCFPMVGTSPKLLKKRGKKPVVKLACNPSSDPHLVAFFLISDFSCFFWRSCKIQRHWFILGPRRHYPLNTVAGMLPMLQAMREMSQVTQQGQVPGRVIPVRIGG